MIPSDLAARLRMIAEASFFDSEPPVQGTARVREVQARLPQLVPGQQFTAQITRGLPDGTFQAIVAGRTYTLALNQSAKPGDALELMVTRNTPETVFARVVGQAPSVGTAGAEGAARADLSTTGRLISFLLTGSGASQTVPLAGGAPLLAHPPAPGSAALAPLLRQALGQSGLFYESHQLQWLAGKLDARALLSEPQGQMSPRGAAQRGESAAASTTSSTATPSPSASASTSARAAVSGAGAGATGTAPTSDGTAARAAESTQSTAQLALHNRVPGVPERLIPIVHQQLEGMATQQFVVHAQAWPGQSIEWIIEDREHAAQESDDDAADRWKTSLRLRLPTLGDIEAYMQLTPAGVALRLHAEDDATITALDAAREQLEEALAAADVPLTGFIAERRHEPE